jgi:hypothetical protein
MTLPEVFLALDEAIRESPSEARAGLVVQLAARLAALGAILAVPPPAGNGRPTEHREPLLTYQEAAHLLRCSPSYVETLVRQGKLEAVTLPATAKGTGPYRRERAGRLRRITLSALRAIGTS